MMFLSFFMMTPAEAQSPTPSADVPVAEPAAAPAAIDASGVADAPDAPVAPPAAPVATAIDASAIVGAPAGPPLSGEALKEQTTKVAKLLRCPVCQGESVADSPSESALAMKREVEDLLSKGYDQEQVLMYFEASYGEFIRLDPKFEGINVLVWTAPATLLVLGGAGVFWLITAGRRSRVSSVTSATSGSASRPASPPVDPALAPYLQRVREQTR